MIIPKINVWLVNFSNLERPLIKERTSLEHRCGNLKTFSCLIPATLNYPGKLAINI